MRSVEQSVCSAGVRRCSEGLFARFSGAARLLLLLLRVSRNRAETGSKLITNVVVGPMVLCLLGQCSYDPRQHRCCALMRRARETGVRWQHGVVGASPKRSDLVTCSPLPESEVVISAETGWCQI